jgi:hypothetical protein
MDKAFWQEIVQNEYEIPEGHSVDELTTELFSYLGSTDPDLRDDIGYIVYANWLEMEKFTQVEIAEQIQILLANLETGIGDTETDSVFLRSFSVLFLAEIIHNDNKNPRLEKAQILEILEKGLWYLNTEKDSRGYVAEKGWAHALAHTADLMRVLAKNEHTGLTEHKSILIGIAKKLISTSDWVYVQGEDDRLSAAGLSILRRDMLPKNAIKEWLRSFTSPNWKGAWTKEESTCAFFNTRNFLRSLYLQVTTEENLPKQNELEKMLLNTIRKLKPY